MIDEIVNINTGCCNGSTTAEIALIDSFWTQMNNCTMIGLNKAYAKELYGYDSNPKFSKTQDIYYLLDLLLFIYRDMQLYPYHSVEYYYEKFDFDCIRKTFFCKGCDITKALAVFGLVSGITPDVFPLQPSFMNCPLSSTCITCGNVFNYTPVSSIPGTVITWSRALVAGISNPAATGTETISEALINTTTSSVLVTYILTLNYDGQITTKTITVSVCPPPVMVQEQNIVSYASISGFPQTITIPAFSCNVPGVTYLWHNSNTGIGIAANGTGNIAPWTTPVNISGSDIVATITVVAENGSCISLPMTFTITIHPSTVILPSGGNGSLFPFVYYPGTTNSWVNDNGSNGLALAGTGNIAPWSIPHNTSGSDWVSNVSVYVNGGGESVHVTTVQIIVHSE